MILLVSCLNWCQLVFDLFLHIFFPFYCQIFCTYHPFIFVKIPAIFYLFPFLITRPAINWMNNCSWLWFHRAVIRATSSYGRSSTKICAICSQLATTEATRQKEREVKTRKPQYTTAKPWLLDQYNIVYVFILFWI